MVLLKKTSIWSELDFAQEKANIWCERDLLEKNINNKHYNYKKTDDTVLLKYAVGSKKNGVLIKRKK